MRNLNRLSTNARATSRIDVQATRETRIKSYGNLGFTNGYGALKKWPHPLSKGSRVPSVPFIPPSSNDRAFSYEASDLYRKEWARGFNQYIDDNKLDVAKIDWDLRNGIRKAA